MNGSRKDESHGGALAQQQLLYIDGKHQAASDGATFPVKNPMTGSIMYNCASASVDDYATAVDNADAAYQGWSRTPPSTRRRIFLRAAEILESYMEEDAPLLLSNEVSATEHWVKVNILATAALFREVAGLVTHIKGEIVPADRPGTIILVERQAVGVIFAIAPWNAPVRLGRPSYPSTYTKPALTRVLIMRQTGEFDGKGSSLPPHLREHSGFEAVRDEPQEPIPRCAGLERGRPATGLP
jgi:benzaldehyde dehydrogenase (NAD)